MALLQDLIKQIDDQTLLQRIMAEVNKLSKHKKFGLVFNLQKTVNIKFGGNRK